MNATTAVIATTANSTTITGYQKDIWANGISIVTRASDHAHIRPVDASLGLEKMLCQLVWICISGMKWQNLVHGGTKASDIIRKVQQAETIASENAEVFPNIFTVLFFDEANTTEAIGIIKEIMCDKSLSGKPIKLHKRLKIIAACNPYRKHSEELIKKLEQAGLGYHVDAENTTDKLGRVPMRRLVYRVQPLPQSMLPLVWDFGQLSTDVEEMYTRQMILRYINSGDLPNVPGLDTVLSKILTVSQNFMRDQRDECSFVSLRDVERVLAVMSWFITQLGDSSILCQAMNTIVGETEIIDVVTRSLILSLGVCYHACLKRRVDYRETVVKHFKSPFIIKGGADQMEAEILRCQTIFLENVVLNPNIASNQALKENVFMMIVCIELRIPLFLVGKPGSSKSLSRTIVADAMQGNAAQNHLFRMLKAVQMISYQCSPLSVPEEIVAIFRQCGAYQKAQDLDRFASVAVLDEIGLAEDSPRMPLKTLHPLLEDGCPDDEEPAVYKKVAFIGISNCALDPAKMNRGILVQREVPDKIELIESASGICSSDPYVQTLISPLIEPMAMSYLQLFENASKEMREFFGLRDFYSLVKMLYGFLFESQKKPTWAQLKHSILRNFGGLEVSVVDPVSVFGNNLKAVIDKFQEPSEDDPDCSSSGMIKACLTGYDKQTESQNRYLLLLTENYGALTILQQAIFSMQNAVVIFGSSFPSDQEYTQQVFAPTMSDQNSLGKYLVNLPPEISSDDEEYMLANIGLFELQPVEIIDTEIELFPEQIIQPSEPELAEETIQPGSSTDLHTLESVLPSCPKRFKTMEENELQFLQDNYHQSKSTKQNTKWGVKLFQGSFNLYE
ncbi:RNF213 [Mytilus coruscus]|uniref:RNF213 n=1 Tax=Mytilus coruscus TaxID=42192 RepID=A0A6J8E342_MYTCO|nr:RNF213 [Mytilus coruscus]